MGQHSDKSNAVSIWAQRVGGESLSVRIASATTAAVLITATFVGGGACLVLGHALEEIPRGLVLQVVLSSTVAMVASHVWMGVSTRPALQRLRVLAPAIREWVARAPSEDLPASSDDEAAAIATAVNLLIRNHQARLDEASRGLLELRAVLERSSQGILVVDGDHGKIRFSNAFFGRTLTIRGQPEGRIPIEVIPLAEVQSAVDSIANGQSSFEAHAADGKRDLVVRASRLDASDILVTVDDVTEFRDAERSRADFVANVSHELRTPVSAIMGYAETLLADRDELPAHTNALVETIDRNARRLRDLFEDLLRLHRIEVRKRALPLRECPLLPILQDAVVSASDVASRRGQTFILDCDAAIAAVVNPEALSTVVANLALNATNYTKDSGCIQVRARRDGDDVVIDVIDDGIGIAQAHHERIFERFYRVDEARSRKVGGTGLGLAIVKHLSLATGLRVTLVSAPGRGSTFTIRISGRPRR